jgi:hypothetical protein
MPQPPRITVDMLQAFLEPAPKELRANGMGESFMLGYMILKHYFSEAWTERYIDPGTAISNFLKVDDSTALRREIAIFRIIDLAEVIFNLQGVEGFAGCIARMGDGVIEGTYAELDFGRMLYLTQVPFRFISPSGLKRADYDIEVLYPDGLVACADAKCKIEGTAVSYNTIMNTLKDARHQLPDDRPGIAFIKIPFAWMQEPEFDVIALKAAQDFLRNTRRIVSVKYYVGEFVEEGTMMRHRHLYKEFSNPDTRFGQNKNWDVFQRFELPPEANGMPAHWQRILFFPDGKIR